jgi:hypothetical protein
MRILIILPILLTFLSLGRPSLSTDNPRYAVSVLPTPVFHTPDFGTIFGGRDGTTLQLDPCGQIRELEFIAFPGSVFRIESAIVGKHYVIYRVSTDEYPYPSDKGYFIDARFVKTMDSVPPLRTCRLPSRSVVLDNLLAAQGSKYVWGGNFHRGIPQMLDMFPPPSGHLLSEETSNHWQLQGVDCSGLLYEATGGYTPRNTSALIHYGKPVPIAGLNADQIIQKVEPLDLIAWNGHVMIVLDRERVIESRLDCGGKNAGVKVRPLREALIEVMKDRIPLDAYKDAEIKGKKGFVIRRWFKDRNSGVRSQESELRSQ